MSDYSPRKSKRQSRHLFDTILSQLKVVGKPDRQGNYTAFCPFHPDQHHPNLKVHPEKGYKCFACDAKGSIRDLAERLGITICTPKEMPMGKRVETRAQAMALLSNRGLRDNTVAHFQIEPDLEREAWYYPVVYRGQVKAWRYKAFPNHQGNKYWWRDKGETFPVYGLDDVQSDNEVWLVAGEADRWICYQAGLKAICFLFGEGTVPQGAVEFLHGAGIRKLNIVYDLDDAGRKGAAKVARILEDAGFKVFIRELPPLQRGHKDMNDLYLELGCDDTRFRETVLGLPGRAVEDRREIRMKGDKDRFGYLARFDGLIDIVDAEGDLAYLIRDKGEIKIISRFENEGLRYVPPPRDQLPYAIPRWSEVQRAYREDSQEALFQDLIEYHRRFSRLPSEDHYILVATWDFSTYLLETFNYSGYIYLYAVHERGKTKTGQAMIYVAFRGIHQENLREADLFRNSEDLGASLFLDVTDLWKKAQRLGSDDILLLRYEKGAKVRRVINPERERFKDSRYYDVFGATVIATNKGVAEIMESRSFPIDMEYAPGNFPKPTPEIGLPFRERLVAWRAHHLGTHLPEIGHISWGRLNDIATPLYQVISLVSPSYLPQFLELIRELGEKRREEKAGTEEASIIKTLAELSEEVEDGKLTVEAVTEKSNRGRGIRFEKSPEHIGRVLRSLGFKATRVAGGKRAVWWNSEKVKSLEQEYGVGEARTPCREPSQPSLQIGNNRIKSDSNDGSAEDTQDTSRLSVAQHIPSKLHDANGEEALVRMAYRGEFIYCALNDDWARLAPPGYMVYTVPEIEMLKDKDDWTKRMVHEAKRYGAKVVSP